MAVETGKTESKDLNQNGDKNVTPVDDLEPSELEKQIIKQIEYYFGDINLPRDKFMLEKIKIDNGWIPMSVMMSFQRLAKLTSDPKIVAKALLHSDLMEVDESGSEIKIRRSPEHPLPELDEARRKALLERSVYCSKFPEETPLDSLIKFFSQFGLVDNIIMRKYKDKVSKTRKFKGSVFVTFKTKEKCQEFLELENVKYEDEEITRMWQSDYIAEKKQDYLDQKMKKMKKIEEEQDTAAAAAAAEEAEMKDNLPKGAIIHFSGDFTGIKRENIKDKLSSMGFDPAYVEYKIGEKEAHVRFSEENAGKNFLEKNGNELEIEGQKLTARLLEGEEEETFLENAALVRSAAIKRRQQARRGGRKSKKGKGNRGGCTGGGKKRKGSPANEESPPVKKPAEE